MRARSVNLASFWTIVAALFLAVGIYIGPNVRANPSHAHGDDQPSHDVMIHEESGDHSTQILTDH